MKNHIPPEPFLRFFRWFCDPELQPCIEGDLLELYEETFIKSGKNKADRRFVMDVLLLFKPEIARPIMRFRRPICYDAWIYYPKTGIKNNLKEFLYKLKRYFN